MGMSADSRGLRPARWGVRVAGASLALLLVGGAVAAANRRAVVTTVQRMVPPRVAPNLLPTPEIAACVSRLPRAPDFHTISDFAHVDGNLRVTWKLTLVPLSAPRDAIEPRSDDLRVRVDLEAGGVVHSELLGSYPGDLYALDLSVCRGAPIGQGPCSGAERAPELQGVISEFSLQDWLAYLPRSSVFWMLVRTPSSALLLHATTFEGRPLDDRHLCDPGVWQVSLEMKLGSTVEVSEEVLFTDPPGPYDCEEGSSRDMRCTG